MKDIQSYIVPLDRTIELPELLNTPFSSSVPMVINHVSQELRARIAQLGKYQEELALGKMFGVMVIEDQCGRVGYISAFSGTLGAELNVDGFVPPIFDYSDPSGYYMEEEGKISAINKKIEDIENSSEYLKFTENLDSVLKQAEMEIEASRREYKEAKRLRALERDSAEFSIQRMGVLSALSQRQKGDLKRLINLWNIEIESARSQLSHLRGVIEELKVERRLRSTTLHSWLFANFRVLNGRGQSKSLQEIFVDTALKTPPSGSGECAAPKLLNFALRYGLRPIAIGEFWWGASPKGIVRHDGHFYEACRGKCVPILGYMLDGVEVEGVPLVELSNSVEVPVIYEDDYILVANKPSGLLTVPGRGSSPSLLSILKQRNPSLMVVHRLDMDTSGVIVLAKDLESYKSLQRGFLGRTTSKVYTAILDGELEDDCGEITLPIIADILDRPRQMVDYQLGKPSLTRFRVIERVDGKTRVHFFPITGRTHQLRLHSAHSAGLATPIVGDRLYGRVSDRLYLHATTLSFNHPHSGDRVEFTAVPPF